MNLTEPKAPEASMQSFTSGVENQLGCYVYRLIDPRDGQTFYIGRGRGDRVFAHIQDELVQAEGEDDLSEKLETIRDIRRTGLEVIHVIHRHGLDEATAAEVEAALIDAFPGLTNIAPGKNSNDRGPAHVQELQTRYERQVMVPDSGHKLLFIKVRQRVVDERGSLYETVRASWVLNPERAKRADYVLAVVEAVCRGVFVADRWSPVDGREKRWLFEGSEVTGDIAERYVGKLIPEDKRKPGMASPILYQNC